MGGTPAAAACRVVLIGESTSGKSSIGPRLADLLGLAHVDLDSTIARQQHRSTEDLFAIQGVEGYQRTNEQVLGEVLTDESLRRAVIVTGAVTPMSPANRQRLIETSDVLVHLCASPRTVHQRLRRSLDDGNPHSAHSMVIGAASRNLELLHMFRAPYYEIAELRIDTDDKTISDVVAETAQAVTDQIERVRPASLPARTPFDAVYESAGGELYYPSPSRTLTGLVAGLAGNRPRVLDLGCGDGRNALMLASGGCETEAVDISGVAIAKILKLARARGLRNLRVSRADVSSCPLPVDRYDLIAATTILDHLPGPAAREVAHRMVNALRPGGYVYATAFTTADPGARARATRSTQRAGISDTASLVDHYFAPGELCAMFRALEMVEYSESVDLDTSHGRPHWHGTAKLIGRRSR